MSRPGSAAHQRRALQQLARLLGVQAGYRGNDGRRYLASDEALAAVCAALGAELAAVGDAPQALRAAQSALLRRVVEPVIAHRLGGSVTISVSIPATVDPEAVWVSLHREDGEIDQRRLGRAVGRALKVDDAGGYRRYSFRLRRGGLPAGYHRLTVEGPGIDASSLVVSAPARLEPPARQWGIGVPLYALRTRGDWGVGSYSDLGAFAHWVGERGGALAGTLPLFATFLDTPAADPSPYLPASRLAWNELYVDVESLAELEAVPDVRAELSGPALRDQLVRLRRSPLAHLGPTLAVKRRLLEPMAQALAAEDPRHSPRRAAFDDFVASHPEVMAYARFRAAREQHGPAWRTWPAGEADAVRSGAARSQSRRIADDPALAYHLYTQWVADAQLAAAADGPGAPAGLYLDIPVGVHPDGFDPFFEPSLFVAGVSGGAPPDDFHAGGQVWGFPPLHPDAIRADGYRHVAAVFRTAMRHAAAVRVDHVMGLQRLFWIPEGGDAGDGAYINYRGDELHAVLVLEAHRSGTVVAGEDLGTVPTTVERAMARDRMLSSFVVQFETSVEEPLPPVPRRAVASFGTHDLPPFAAYWRGLDIGDRRRRDHIDAEDAARRRRLRDRWRSALLASLPLNGLAALPDDGDVVEARRAWRGCLRHLAASPAEVVMIDLEDLWLETEPQNRPGTGPEAGNFRRRTRRALEEATADPEIAVLLREVDALRRPEPASATGTDHEGAT